MQTERQIGNPTVDKIFLLDGVIVALLASRAFERDAAHRRYDDRELSSSDCFHAEKTYSMMVKWPGKRRQVVSPAKRKLWLQTITFKYVPGNFLQYVRLEDTLDRRIPVTSNLDQEFSEVHFTETMGSLYQNRWMFVHVDGRAAESDEANHSVYVMDVQRGLSNATLFKGRPRYKGMLRFSQKQQCADFFYL